MVSNVSDFGKFSYLGDESKLPKEFMLNQIEKITILTDLVQSLDEF